MQQLPLGVRWRDNSTFAGFVRGPNSQAVGQVEDPRRAPAVVLWLWAPSGSGKTHLIQASCARAGELGRTAAYFPLRECNAIEPQALAGCEHLDLVCIDDAEQAAGHPGWERALFNLHNGLQEHDGRLLLTGLQPPAAVAWSLPDLKSRLAAGLVLHLQPLGEDDRMQVLRLRARNRGLELPDETAAFLLRHYPRDLRTLCALLDTLDLASLAAQRRLTIPFIKSAIHDAASGSSRLDAKESAC